MERLYKRFFTGWKVDPAEINWTITDHSAVWGEWPSVYIVYIVCYVKTICTYYE